MTNYRKQQCKGKRQFPSREAADALGTKMEPYQCQICGGWHLTSGMAGRLNKQILANTLAINQGFVKPSRVGRKRRKRFTERKKPEG